MAPGPDPSVLADLQAASFERANQATRSSWAARPEDARRATRSGPAAPQVRGGRLHPRQPASARHAGRFRLARRRGLAPRGRGRGPRAQRRGDPWLSVVITEGDADDHGVVVLEGPARVLPLADAPASLADSIAAKGGEYPDWASVWLVVTPSRLLSHAAPGWKAP